MFSRFDLFTGSIDKEIHQRNCFQEQITKLAIYQVTRIGEHHKTDRSWMYDRVNSDRYGLKDEFVNGVEDFTPNEVKHHLYKFGFLPNYYKWIDHGEEIQNVDLDGHSSNGGNAGGDNTGDEEQFDTMNEMVSDVFRPFVNVPNVNIDMENENVSESEVSLTQWNISLFTYLIKQSLVVLYNIVGCIHLKD
ncbi:unnamed protein product [Vicia faba]|uniref:Uncharacterized protein n=1 Tax=Vicia faba TaxID=3906 RepID=A0AAV0YFD0_VICFA|nr:unnamed protein product [Vicia faba]